MAKDEKKLRKRLANLFKMHGNMTINSKPNYKSQTTKMTSKIKRTQSFSNDYLNCLADDQIDFVEPEFKKPKLKNEVQTGQGKGSLAKNVNSKRINGKIKKIENKKSKAFEIHKSGEESSRSKDKVKKLAQKKQPPRSEGGESKRMAGDSKSSETESSEKINKNQNRKATSKKKSKQKAQENQQQQQQQQDSCPVMSEIPESKTEKTTKPKENKSKTNNNHPSPKDSKSNLGIEFSSTMKPTESYSYDSMLESDYDSNLDDTYELSSVDYDSDDYYYDDDSSADSQASICGFESYEDDFMDESFSDPDYELPGEEVEDLVVHNGLAVKYDLEPDHGAEFDENTEEGHIVELPNQTPVKSVEQNVAYSVEKLRALELNFCATMSKLSIRKSEVEECPQLVPIGEDKEGFELWTSGINMDDEMFSDSELVEDSDESSVTSCTDLNRKYLREQCYCQSSETEETEEEQENKGNEMHAIIVDSKQSQPNGDLHEETNIRNIIESEIEETQPSLAEFVNAVNDTTLEARIIKGKLENFGQQEGTKTMDVEMSVEDSMDTFVMEEYLSPQNATVDSLVDQNNDEASITANCNREIENFKLPKRKSKLRSIFCNSMDSYYVLVLMKSPFFIYGTVNAKLIAGSTEIYGYKLKDREMVTVHSPRGCCAIPFQPALSTRDLLSKEALEKKVILEISSLSDIAEFNWKEIKDLLSVYDPQNDAILLLTRNENAAKIKQIFQQHMNENIFPPHIPQLRPFFSSEIMLDCMLNASHDNALEVPSEWLDIHLKVNSKLMLVGGKSVGKSTLLRYLLNRHLDEFPFILLIDLDIGQPEIFVPQTVSCCLLSTPLLGPGFFYQHEPDKAYAVGHTNFTLCAHNYMRAVIKLLNFCKTQTAYSNVPWLINTMGYNRGFAGELISVICSHLQPTDIIQLQSNKPINNFDVLFEPSNVAKIPRIMYHEPEFERCSSTKYEPNHQLHLLNSAVLQQSRYQQEWQMSAKDLRYAMQLARLSATLPDDGEWINNSETFCHNFEKLKIVNLVAPESDEKETLKSLENNLVYLCHIETLLSKEQDIRLNSAPICLGIGIVRAIDYQANQIYILPAMPLEKMTSINCLALGEMPLPSSLLTEQNPESKFNVPFVQVMNDEATSRAVKQFFYRT